MNNETIFFSAIIFLIIGIILFYLLRIFIRFYKTKKAIDRKDVSEVGFVVDTFHDLVAKLKEKERELELLKNRAEDRAMTIEGYNENILQSVPSGVISFDEELKITKINHAAEKILEIKGESATGNLYTDMLMSPITDLLVSKKLIERNEISYLTPSGKKIWLGLTLSPLKDGAGTTIGQILVFTDLTHLKAIESQMNLRDKLSSLGEISAGIAHELRNPMAVIAGYTKLLLRKVDDAAKPTVDAISKEIVVMDRIISDFLSFAKPPALSIASVDLNPIIDACVQSITVERDDIVRHLDIDRLPPIKGDEVLLRQAFTNLVQNAVDAMPQGGALSIKAMPVTVPGSNVLDIIISDTGHGISENIRDKIFLPFFTTKEKGTGLGLAIVHKIVVSHGGSISVESSDKGTTFRIRFPGNSIR
jgi:two-component system, NtrC family, sensor histidine kinase PilS